MENADFSTMKFMEDIMLTIYGTKQCRFCVECKSAFDAQGVSYNFVELLDDLQVLKRFIHIRDTNPVYEGIQGSGKLGIPLIETEDGVYTRDWKQFLPEHDKK